MEFVKKQLVNLGKKALAEVVADEQKRKQQMDAYLNYLDKFSKTPSELTWLLQALIENQKNAGKKRKNKTAENLAYHCFGWAYGVIEGKLASGYYVGEESDALQNIVAYWYGKGRNEEIFLKNVLLYGEP